MSPAEELATCQAALAGALGEAPTVGGAAPDPAGAAAPAGDAWLEVPAARWREACRAARDLPELGFDFLRSLAGVDRPEAGRIDVVAHLFSYRHRRALVLRTSLERAAPELDSVAQVWPAADWHERELWDLLGVRLRGHPDLRRLLLPEDWPGHPLRKDWQEPAEYRGIPTRREARATAGELAKQTYLAPRGLGRDPAGGQPDGGGGA
ncbi:MAG TPA: NADH-quinone oxidoreductase subunit C [Myxococcota bacterium]|nr:NADH-quinone oxidoreductase subunit C [Myxococcota bacterium]HRY96552.1 NADH-quinone oxidoreductase subunit C [Myxococcota bacterium]HSA21896.1 NADH-quinone oxidoreductase subunit C [Myxococcota bacterium]